MSGIFRSFFLFIPNKYEKFFSIVIITNLVIPAYICYTIFITALPVNMYRMCLSPSESVEKHKTVLQ